jgi:hypothetical protein
VVLLLEDPELQASRTQPLVEADHGRIETRTTTASPEIGWLRKQHQWPGVKAIGKVERRRETAETTTTETAYNLLSSDLTAERLNVVVRQHWSTENPSQRTLAIGCGDERGSGPNASLKWSAQSGRAPLHGHQRRTKREFQRRHAWKIQTCRLR